jgi:hypothetical protein
MPTIRKGDHASLPARHVSYRERVDQARALARAAAESGGNIAHERAARFEFQDPVDLRGIPAIGRGVAGHIPGTHPEKISR